MTADGKCECGSGLFLQAASMQPESKDILNQLICAGCGVLHQHVVTARKESNNNPKETEWRRSYYDKQQRTWSHSG